MSEQEVKEKPRKKMPIVGCRKSGPAESFSQEIREKAVAVGRIISKSRCTKFLVTGGADGLPEIVATEARRISPDLEVLSFSPTESDQPIEISPTPEVQIKLHPHPTLDFIVLK